MDVTFYQNQDGVANHNNFFKTFDENINQVYQDSPNVKDKKAGSQQEYGIGGLTLASIASSSDPFRDGM